MSDLLEEYEFLKQTYADCEREYKRLAGCYNAVVEQNKKLQEELRKCKK